MKKRKKKRDRKNNVGARVILVSTSTSRLVSKIVVVVVVIVPCGSVQEEKAFLKRAIIKFPTTQNTHACLYLYYIPIRAES